MQHFFKQFSFPSGIGSHATLKRAAVFTRAAYWLFIPKKIGRSPANAGNLRMASKEFRSPDFAR
jgi:hypothetical protein